MEIFYIALLLHVTCKIWKSLLFSPIPLLTILLLITVSLFQFELIYFNNINMDHHEQYRWYQVDYQIGVFISRSSLNLFQIKRLWILALLQVSSLDISFAL